MADVEYDSANFTKFKELMRKKPVLVDCQLSRNVGKLPSNNPIPSSSHVLLKTFHGSTSGR